MLTLEFVLIAPLLLVLVLAGVEFAAWLMATQAVSAAACVGARAASVTDATLATVEAAVAQALDDWKFGQAIDPVAIKVTNQVGDMSTDLADAQTGDMVKVIVSVDVVDAVPDLLNFFGVLLSGEKLTASCVARKE